MKYHLPESSGYARTVAEVWFNSEEAAQASGFTRAPLTRLREPHHLLGTPDFLPEPQAPSRSLR